MLEREVASLKSEKQALKLLVDGLDQALANTRAAASSAAATTVTAIERIQEMEKVVKAAEEWARGGSHAALTDAVVYWQKLKGTWS